MESLNLFSEVFMPDISISHNTGTRLAVAAVTGIVGIDFNVRNRNMKEIHVNPTPGIKPDLDKQIGVVLTSPGHIVGAGIEIPPNHPIPAVGGGRSTQRRDGFEGTSLRRVDHGSDLQIIDGGVA